MIYMKILSKNIYSLNLSNLRKMKLKIEPWKKNWMNRIVNNLGDKHKIFVFICLL